jgi:hypothetical protein
MASIDTEILDAAFREGLFAEPLNKDQLRIVLPSIVTAWDIIEAIGKKGSDGISVAALSADTRIHANTVKIYCRWLREAKLIDCSVDPGSQGSALIYFPRQQD